MMRHEMSQSAAYVHWTDYPYMFPHVDITFAFLEKLRTYARITGDADFVRTHWDAIRKAYEYCVSLVDPDDGLPRVPRGKEGSDEQRQPREELSLAVAWMQASAAFADLARLSGHEQLAPAAQAASARAAQAIPAHFWNARTGYFASGILNDGTAEPEMHVPPEAALPLLDDVRRAAVLDRIAGLEFQTAWGTRGVGSASPTYDPGSYATGSVWAGSTATAASELWNAGRAEAAWKVWRSLLPCITLDSMATCTRPCPGQLSSRRSNRCRSRHGRLHCSCHRSSTALPDSRSTLRRILRRSRRRFPPIGIVLAWRT